MWFQEYLEGYIERSGRSKGKKCEVNSTSFRPSHVLTKPLQSLEKAFSSSRTAECPDVLSYYEETTEMT